MLNSFLLYMGKKEWQSSDFCRGLNDIQPELSRTEYKRLLQAAKLLGKERTYLLIKTMGGAGVRVQELLQILLYTGSGGIRREVLLSRLYGGDSSKDRADNLRVTVYHLRKILRETELSDKADICIRNGMYAFECDCAIEIDAHLFDELHREAETAQGSKCLELLKKACAVYGGLFPASAVRRGMGGCGRCALPARLYPVCGRSVQTSEGTGGL